MRRGLDVLIGVVYLVVIAALVALSIAIYQHRFTSYVDVSVRTDSVGSSLSDGSDVQARGVLVGEVSSVSTDGDGARINLHIYPSKARELPANMLVRLLPKTLFGERYVDLMLPDDPHGHLRSGATLHQDVSASAIELETLFTDLLPVLQAVQPQKLAASLGEVAAALRHRGTAIGTLLATTGRYLTQLAPHVPRIGEDLQRLAAVADNYNDVAPTLLQGLATLTTTTKTLARQKQDVDATIAGLTHAGGSLGELVGTSEQQIIGLAADSRAPLRTLQRYASEFPCLTQALVDYIPTADKAFGVGTRRPGAHITLHVVPTQKAYTRADAPHYSATGGPRCPYTPATALAATALADTPGIQGTDTTTTRVSAATAGMGTANSPQENRLIAELMAASAHTTPAKYPQWSSLLLGGALRGTEVVIK